MATKDIKDPRTRYMMNLPLRYRPVAKRGGEAKGGWARNLNCRGAWVELPERVRPRSTLEITLATPVGNLSMVARVAWAQSDPPSAPYLHGVRFTGVTPDQREQLCTFFAHERPFPARVDCMLAATCQRNDEGCPAAIPGIARDLSDGGVCVHLPRHVDPGTELCIHAATPFGRLTADAQVVWAEHAQARLSRGRLYRHGLRFLRVPPSSEGPLRALVYGIR